MIPPQFWSLGQNLAGAINFIFQVCPTFKLAPNFFENEPKIFCSFNGGYLEI